MPDPLDALYPVDFERASMSGTSAYFNDPTVCRVIEFFRNKGYPALKQEDKQEDWYPDWIAFQGKHGIYATLLCPKRYSTRGRQFDLMKLTRFLEVFTYFSPAHAYSLHVSFLGLFPILMSANDELKKEAIAKLEAGELFAFAVSEKAHGSDLFANTFTVQPGGAGKHVASGSKYYIGNANAASIISVLGKAAGTASAGPKKRSPFMFFALRPRETKAFQNLRKIRTLGIRSAFVGEFDVKEHVFADSDVISEGREAWEAVFGTVILGKFFLGFGAVGICEHSFAEAFAHMRGRVLYGKPVTEMPHIRATSAVAFARMTAMKFYAYRALDYLQVSSQIDRRYLLFNAVQKAKVSTEGVKVIGLLAECIGARGVEAETYFESALRESQLIPGLEGSTHINFGITAQFIDAYFSGTPNNVPNPPALAFSSEAPENGYLQEGKDRNAKTVVFSHFLLAYKPLQAIPNVHLFVEQVIAFQQFVEAGSSALNPSMDAGLFIGMGKCFSTIVYAQLIAENCLTVGVGPSMASVIFHGLIEDLSAELLKLSAMFSPESESRSLLKRGVLIPETITADLEAVSKFIAERYAD